MSADPVSWLLIKRGWRMLAPTGAKLGWVWRLNDDKSRDIFDGMPSS